MLKILQCLFIALLASNANASAMKTPFSSPFVLKIFNNDKPVVQATILAHKQRYLCNYAEMYTIVSALEQFLQLQHIDPLIVSKFTEDKQKHIISLWLYNIWSQNQSNACSHDSVAVKLQAISEWDRTLGSLKNKVAINKADSLNQLLALEDIFKEIIANIDRLNYFVQSGMQSNIISALATKATIEPSKEYSIVAIFNLGNFTQFLKQDVIRENRLVYIVVDSSVVAIFRVGEVYYYFDTQSTKSHEQKFLNIEQLAQAIFKDKKRTKAVGFVTVSMNGASEQKYPDRNTFLLCEGFSASSYLNDLATNIANSIGCIDSYKQFIPSYNAYDGALFDYSALLTKALIKFDLGIVKEILLTKEIKSYKADPYTPIMLAVIHGQDDLLELLLCNNKIIFLKDEVDKQCMQDSGSSWTALMYAIKYRRKHAAMLLLEQGKADVNKIGAIEILDNLEAARQTSDLIIPLPFYDVDLDQASEAPKNTLKNALCIAVDNNDFGMVQMLMSHGANINDRLGNGDTVLMHAAVQKDTRILKLLLAAHANINIKNADGETALSLAAKNMNPAALFLLLTSGASVNNQEHDIFELLVRNDKKTASKIIASILKHDRFVDDKYIKLFAELVVASEEKNTQDLDRLLKIAVERSDVEYSKLLTWAAYYGSYDLTKIILENENVDSWQKMQDSEALISAAMNGHDDIVRLLIENKASINHKNSAGLSALMAAVGSGRDKVVESLLGCKGIAINAKDAHGRTAVIFAAYYGRERILYDLLEAGADVNDKDKDGWTALMFAVHSGKDQIMFALLRGKANINDVDGNGLTALMLAVAKNQVKAVEILLRYGANVDIKVMDKTAFDMAVCKNNQEIVALFNKYLTSK